MYDGSVRRHCWPERCLLIRHEPQIDRAQAADGGDPPLPQRRNSGSCLFFVCFSFLVTCLPIQIPISSKNVQILVSTSVSEEGIDIPACQLVIRFNGINTSASYVQCRGRARQHGSSYVVMLPAGDVLGREYLWQIRRGELCMRVAALWEVDDENAVEVDDADDAIDDSYKV
jgi:hypothetical protein